MMTIFSDSRMPAFLLILLALSLLTACGTFEVGIVHVGDSGGTDATQTMPPEAVIVRTAIGTPPQPTVYLGHIASVPTPTGQLPAPQPAFTPQAMESFSAPDGLRVALVTEGNVWLWAAEPKAWAQLTTGAGVDGDVRISDDGAFVAFVRGEELWAVDSDGGSERRLVAAEDLAAVEPTDPGVRLHRFAWVPGTHTLAWNTRLHMAIGEVLNDDLHLVNADTLERTALLPPGEGGEFHYSPDGLQIALVTRGDISLIDADGTRRRDAVLTYTPVSTRSEYAFYVQPIWAADGSALRVAIPPPDPQAAPGQRTTIWHIPSSGSPAGLVATLDVVPMLGPDVVSISPDLRFVAYVQLRQGENGPREDARTWLEVLRLENGDRMAFLDAGAFLGWAEDSMHFTFVSGREKPQLQIGQWSGRLQPGGVDAGNSVTNLCWVDAGYHLFLAHRAVTASRETNGWDLVLSDVHGANTVLMSTDAFPRFDCAIAKGRTLPLPFRITPTPLPTASPQGGTAALTSGVKAHNIELVGYLGSSPVDVLAVQRDRAYVGSGNELSVIDVSSPSAMARLGYVVLDAPVLDIAVAGSYAYAATDNGAGLCIIDASAPARPKVLDTLYEGLRLSGVTISEGYAYVSTGSLHILDLTNPAIPVEMATHYYPYSLTAVEGKVVSVQGGLAYSTFVDQAEKSAGFRIVDVSDPAVPSTVASFRTDSPVQDMAVVGGHAYLLVGEGVPHLAVMDIADPQSVFELSVSSSGPWAGTQLKVDQGRAYLALPAGDGQLAGLQVLDVSDPANPMARQRYESLAPELRSLAVKDGLVFVTTGDGLMALDESEPLADAPAGFYAFDRISATSRDVAVLGDYAYVAAGWDGLQVVDLSRGANPRVVGALDTPGHAWAIALSDGLAYVADENRGLRVIDVHDPRQPFEVGFYDVPGPYEFFHGVAIEGGYAYVADGQGLETGLRVFDVVDPTNPTEVALVPLSAPGEGALSPRVEDVAVADGYAYMASGTAGLCLVSVSDPTSPVAIGCHSTPGRADDLTVSGHLVYLADGDLRILDVSDPMVVTEVGFYDVPGSAQAPSVAVHRSRAVVTGRGLTALDVSDPSMPSEVAVHPLPHGRVAMDADRVCVVNGGLFVLRLFSALG